MSSKKTTNKKKKSLIKNKSCVCGSGCHDKHAHLPGYLLMALGLLAIPIQFDMIQGMSWAKMWPVAVVLLGLVVVVKTTICRTQKTIPDAVSTKTPSK